MKAWVMTGVAVGILAGVLSGCATTQTSQTEGVVATTQKIGDYRVRTQSFACENGLKPTIQYMSETQIILTVEGVRTPMDIAQSASGSRYASTSGLFGQGGSWHESHHEAFFDYQDVAGVDIETKCVAD